MAKARPIIVIKKKASHGGHHGGAWKVAYADFVTAMMALFIVLWLMNTSEKVRKAVAGYFNDPQGTSAKEGTDRAGTDEALPINKENIDKLKEQLEKTIRQKADLAKLSNQIEIKITPEGLRIELLETDKGTFFESGSTTLSTQGQEILTLLAGELKDLPNHISMEGHTDAQPYSGKTNYSNWELSTDRANTARRLMQERGLRHDQITQVRGYADQKLRVPSNPLDASNRRISLIVQYLDAPAEPPTAKSGSSPPGQEKKSETASSEKKPEEKKPEAEAKQAAETSKPAGASAPSGGSTATPANSKPAAGTPVAANTAPAKKSLLSVFSFKKK